MGIKLPVEERELFQHSLIWGMIPRRLVKRFPKFEGKKCRHLHGSILRTLISPEASEYFYALRSLIHPTEQDPQLLCCYKISSQEMNLSSRVQTEFVTHQASFWNLLLWGKLPSRVADHTNPHVSEVRNDWSQVTPRPNILP